MGVPDLSSFSLDIKLLGVNFKRDLEQDIGIDNTDLQTEFMEHPAKFAWWATVCEYARRS